MSNCVCEPYIKGADAETITQGADFDLAEPQTIQLTPQEVHALLGDNNIWADSGEVSVTYKADVTKWVEKKLS